VCFQTNRPVSKPASFQHSAAATACAARAMASMDPGSKRTHPEPKLVLLALEAA
jgi:hypothetical protein